MPLHHKDKEWSELKSESSWRIFKIMSEFVEGFETLNNVGPCVSIFGSARTHPDHPHYQMAVAVAEGLVKAGYGIITGGGPGAMEAGNRGAKNAKGKSVGLGITLPHEQRVNDFVDLDKIINHKYFFVRKVMFVKYAQAFVFMPGGFGTLDELFECLTLVQTRKISQVPMVLMGVSFWTGMLQWMKDIVLDQEHNINPNDLDMLYLTDDVEDAVNYVNAFYKQGLGELQPNF
ncbi:MAG: TIGR00730 family Rossman fold protein [Chitinophagales bacterium]|jgi:uncharacterized protein (TIGR00730 family)|nr:TIGR00730 family Rossman fold protein [Sphingobacteriales bacterium]MBP7533442.1 TIGR00730 family Rossman fold protein [Chitinophagales bacterium]